MSEKKRLTTQAKVMIVIIVMMVVGIITRWDFISSEISTVWRNMFPTENSEKVVSLPSQE